MQVPVGLEPHPELGRGLQEPSEPQRRIRSDAALTEHDLVQAVERHTELLGGRELPHAQRLQILLQKQLAWVDRRTSQSWRLVIVLDGDFVGMAVLPAEGYRY